MIIIPKRITITITMMTTILMVIISIVTTMQVTLIAITIMITILTIATTMMMKSIATHQRMVSSFATTMIFIIHHFTKKVIPSTATRRIRLLTLRLVTSIIISIATTMITAIT